MIYYSPHIYSWIIYIYIIPYIPNNQPVFLYPTVTGLNGRPQGLCFILDIQTFEFLGVATPQLKDISWWIYIPIIIVDIDLHIIMADKLTWLAGKSPHSFQKTKKHILVYMQLHFVTFAFNLTNVGDIFQSHSEHLLGGSSQLVSGY